MCNMNHLLQSKAYPDGNQGRVSQSKKYKLLLCQKLWRNQVDNFVHLQRQTCRRGMCYIVTRSH